MLLAFSTATTRRSGRNELRKQRAQEAMSSGSNELRSSLNLSPVEEHANRRHFFVVRALFYTASVPTIVPTPSKKDLRKKPKTVGRQGPNGTLTPSLGLYGSCLTGMYYIGRGGTYCLVILIGNESDFR
jgi:hypothetical protein